jgi:D-alanyl-D-alanine carboxypeptidase
MEVRPLLIATLLFIVLFISPKISAPQGRPFGANLITQHEKDQSPPITPQPIVTLPRLHEAAERNEEPMRRKEIPDITINAAAALAITDRGATLFALNEETPLQIASISKLMTALVALDRLPLSAPVVVTKEAIRTEGDSAGLIAGETLRLHDALLALLVPSSNDAAVAIAEAAGGTASFIAAMNAKAAELGMEHSHFTNPHGLTPQGNTASARDVARLMGEVLRNPTIREMLRQRHSRIVSAEGFVHEFDTTNLLLDEVDGAIGGKTGFTTESQGTLVFAFSPRAAQEHREAREDDPSVITVVLGSSDRFADTEALARWVLAAYRWEFSS